MICPFLTVSLFYFLSPHANFCLHNLLPLTWHHAYPRDLGYVAQSAQLQELTEDSGTMQRRHGSEMGRKKQKNGGRQRGEEIEHCTVKDGRGPAGGSPQAMSDIPLSDGLMRLP